jgi:hypothetical protein
MELYATTLRSARLNSRHLFPAGFKSPTAKPIADLLDHQLRRMRTMVERPYTDAFCVRIDVLPECCGSPGLSVTTAMSSTAGRPLVGSRARGGPGVPGSHSDASPVAASGVARTPRALRWPSLGRRPSSTRWSRTDFGQFPAIARRD